MRVGVLLAVLCVTVGIPGVALGGYYVAAPTNHFSTTNGSLSIGGDLDYQLTCGSGIGHSLIPIPDSVSSGSATIIVRMMSATNGNVIFGSGSGGMMEAGIGIGAGKYLIKDSSGGIAAERLVAASASMVYRLEVTIDFDASSVTLVVNDDAANSVVAASAPSSLSHVGFLCASGSAAFSSVIVYQPLERSGDFVWVPCNSFVGLSPLCYAFQYSMPGQVFAFIFPEWFGSYSVDLKPYPVWKFDAVTADGGVDAGNYAFTMHVAMNEMPAGVLQVDWEYGFTNKTGTTLPETAAFNCFSLQDAPQFINLGMDRTFVTDQGGTPKAVVDVDKDPLSPRDMQFYPVDGGVDLDLLNNADKHGCTSPETLSPDKIWLVSADPDQSWTIDNIVNGNVAFFFNNWEGNHGCIHAAPAIGDVGPGETKNVSGAIRFCPKSVACGVQCGSAFDPGCSDLPDPAPAAPVNLVVE